ncbi:polysaccharide biosynthesis/export family protein [Amaricoccus solimangrovi]|nr:polysaccharide biosynthesis/export family protein [Amaricoccus solimangrovi]
MATHLRLAALLAAPLLAAPALAGSYLLQPGDVLELYVAGRAEIRARMPVDIDGEIVAPLAGVLPAAGRPLAEITEEIRARIAMAALPVTGGNGLSSAEHIHPSLVSVGLGGYRPVYVDGAVRRPGAHDFVPGLTARQAIALAGGIGPAGESGDPALRTIELRARIDGLRARLRASEARIARLRAEADPEPDSATDPEPEAGDAPEPVALERLTGSLRRARSQADLAYLDAAAGLAATEHDALARQLAAETEGAAADAAEFARLSEAGKAGSITAARLAESRRGLLFARSGQWETEARLASLARDQRLLGNLRAQRALQAREEAAAALAGELPALEGLRAELAAAGETLARVAGAGAASRLRVEVSRGAAPALAVAPGEDAPLRPGDIVHVAPAPDPARGDRE